MIIRNRFGDLLKENKDCCQLSQNIRAIKASTRLEIIKRISLAKEWMEENYNSTISLEDIASVTAMNSQHFLRMFKQIHYITPHQYLMELRLNKAKGLLESSRLAVTEICLSNGFESIFSFSTLFKARFGFAPSHFRKAD